MENRAIQNAYKTKTIKENLLAKVIDGLIIYAENNGSLNDLENKDIWRIAGVYRATYYRNFPHINDIYMEIKRNVTEEMEINLAPYLNSEAEERISLLFYKFFIMLEIHSKACKIAIYRDDISFWRSVISVLKPFIKSSWKYCSEKSFNLFYEVYLAEMIHIIRSWCEKGFDSNLIRDCVDQAKFFLDQSRSLQNGSMCSYLEYRPLYSDRTPNSQSPNG